MFDCQVKSGPEGKGSETMDRMDGSIGVSEGSVKVFPEVNTISLASSSDSKSEAHVFFGVFLPDAVDNTNEPSKYNKVLNSHSSNFLVIKILIDGCM